MVLTNVFWIGGHIVFYDSSILDSEVEGRLLF